jgi:hypothetical protein
VDKPGLPTDFPNNNEGLQNGVFAYPQPSISV